MKIEFFIRAYKNDVLLSDRGIREQYGMFNFFHMFRTITPITILTLILSLSVCSNANEGKVLLKGCYLKFEGGFRIPLLNELGTPNMKWSKLSIDQLPGSKKWVLSHPAGYVEELLEPAELGTGDVSTWPTLALGRYHKVFESVDKISPEGVFWLDNDNILTSGRKSYRSRFTNNWIGQINLDTGEETLYTIKAESDTENDNFHVLQALGSGFMRITDTKWADSVAYGNKFLLGRGGYDVLGSPLGPALGAWKIGEPYAKFILDFPLEHPARRDPYYTYPSRDPNTYDKVQLPMWHDPDEIDGFWQAGDVGGLAFINHPDVKGVLATHNYARGVLDYRAQGDGGSGAFFSVQNPSVFYSSESTGGNRSNHEAEILNASYPHGIYGRSGLVYNPADLQKVAVGDIEPWEVESKRFEWPKEGVVFSEDEKQQSRLGGVYWDDTRQLLWVAITWPSILVAYSIEVDNSCKEEPVQIPQGLFSSRMPESVLFYLLD